MMLLQSNEKGKLLLCESTWMTIKQDDQIQIDTKCKNRQYQWRVNELRITVTCGSA